MKEILTYNNIDDYLADFDAPPSMFNNFSIVKLEDYQRNEAPRSFGPYKSKFFEISLTNGYNASISVDARKNQFNNYNIIFTSPGQVMTWELDERLENPASYILLFKPEFTHPEKGLLGFYQDFPFFNKYTTPTYHLAESQNALFLQYLKEMLKEYKLGATDSYEVLKPMLSLFLLKAKRELQASANIHFQKSRAEEITYLFENLLQAQKVKRHPIEYFAEKLNISAVYLAECIRKVTHKSAKQVIDEYIVLDAKTRLQQSTQSISEISFDLGFSEVTNFVKFYKRQTGETPKSFRTKPNL